jgi:hypothetical protein
MRYPWINPYWGNANGVFCVGTTEGNLPSATAEIKLVNLEDYSQSHNDLISQVTLNSTGDTLLVNLRQLYSGYVASYYRASFNFTSAEDQKLFLKDQVKFGTKSENIVSTRTENEGFENYSDNKPFIIEAKVKAPELVERAGNKILVKIGDLIGQQVEMYQEKPRQFPMELSFPQILERSIEFVIPEGYSVMNPEDLNIKKILKDDEKISTGFTSRYTLEGNILKIHILEEYRNTLYDLTQYEEYKNIINAAADFNKVVLVLDTVKK